MMGISDIGKKNYFIFELFPCFPQLLLTLVVCCFSGEIIVSKPHLSFTPIIARYRNGTCGSLFVSIMW